MALSKEAKQRAYAIAKDFIPEYATLRDQLAEAMLTFAEAESIQIANYAIDRMKEAQANKPDYEKLWAEEKEKNEKLQQTIDILTL